MGGWLTRISYDTIYGGKRHPVKELADSGTQTHVALSDRLTNYGARETGSTEHFDHVCDICDEQEKEAVAFCTQCDQYYCIPCCRCHERMTCSRLHSIIDRAGLDDVPNKKKLFERELVPLTVDRISDCKRIDCLASSTSLPNCIVGKIISKNLNAIKVINNIGINYLNSQVDYIHMVVGMSTSQREVLFSVPQQKQIRKCIVHRDPKQPSPYKWMHYKTSGECWGLAEFDGGFAVSVKIETGYSLPDWQVQYWDTKGSIKKQIYYDNQGNALFTSPKYLVSNHTMDILYVSDNEKQAIIALDTIGAVLYVFSYNDLGYPRALTVDDEDNVYVACGDNVVQIHKSGAKHRILIKKSKDKPDILSVCFDPASRKLFIGEASDNIKTFNFLP